MAQMQESLRESIRIMNKKSEATVADLKSQIQELKAGPPAEIPGLPLEQCPPTTSGNPWRPVAGGAIEDGMFKLNHENWFILENVEFYPSQKDFPRCYYRLNSAAAGNRIPAETVLLQ